MGLITVIQKWISEANQINVIRFNSYGKKWVLRNNEVLHC